MTTSVAVIEDNPNFLEKFVNIIASAPEFSLFGIAIDGRSGLDLIKRGPADIYLVDLGLPNVSGNEVIRTAVSNHPGCKVMVVTIFGDEDNIIASIEAGAKGYVLKDGAAGDVLDCMRNLRDGGAWLSPIIARKILDRIRLEQSVAASLEATAAGIKERAPVSVHLTKREIELLQELAKGLSFAEISALMFISTHTVAQHIKNIYRKLSVNSRGEAVYAASKMGLIG